MWIDAFKSSSMGHYSVVIAQKWGLEVAIYFSALVDASQGGMVTVDREFLQERTTLSPEKQRLIEQYLMQQQLISEPADGEKGSFRLNLYFNEGISLDPQGSLRKVGGPTRAKQKQRAIRERLKSHITIPEKSVQEALGHWIDAVIERKGWLSVKAVTEGQEALLEFCGEDKDRALQVIAIAEKGGWQEMSWAIDKYKRDYPSKVVKEVSQPKPVGRQVF